VNFGGISVGGMVGNRKLFGQTWKPTTCRTRSLKNGAFCRGMPEEGAQLADELLHLIALHDASNIAAVIVEPFAGLGRRGDSAGGLPAAPARDLHRRTTSC
jgi:beta-alanine--pyruvate transaminase